MAKKRKKKSGPNKSAAIREYAKAHPEAGPTEICKELKKKGISVAPALVSNVKGAMLGRKPKARRKPGRRPGRPVGSVRKAGRPAANAAANDKVSLSALLQARDFSEKVGGLDKAEAIIKALGKLS